MLNNSLRLAILALILTNATNAMSDQKIKTKSNVKNDRIEQPASPDVKSPEAVTDSTKNNNPDKPATNSGDATKSSSENISSAASNVKKTAK